MIIDIEGAEYPCCRPIFTRSTHNTVSSVRSLHCNLFEKIEHGPQMMFVDISDERDNMLSNLQPPRIFDGILAGKGDT
jgi:hypothetical protein